jgi:hypothetical protein
LRRQHTLPKQTLQPLLPLNRLLRHSVKLQLAQPLSRAPPLLRLKRKRRTPIVLLP